MQIEDSLQSFKLSISGQQCFKMHHCVFCLFLRRAERQARLLVITLASDLYLHLVFPGFWVLFIICSCHLQFDRVWSIFLDQICPKWIKLDQTWSNLIKLDQTWSNLIKLDQTWSNLIKLDQTWSNLIKLDFSPIKKCFYKKFSHLQKG